MKRTARSWEETLDEAVSDVVFFFLVLFITATAFNFVSIGVVLAGYALFTAVGIMVACLLHKLLATRARKQDSEDPDLAQLLVEIEKSSKPERREKSVHDLLKQTRRSLGPHLDAREAFKSRYSTDRPAEGVSPRSRHEKN